MEKKPGKFFDRVSSLESILSTSSAVWSRTQQPPATWSRAADSGTWYIRRPITRPSSASAVTRLLSGGSGMGSPAPMTVWPPLKKSVGSSVGRAARSAACGR